MSTATTWVDQFQYSFDHVSTTQGTVVLDGQQTQIAGSLHLTLQSSATGSQKYLTVDMSDTVVSASSSGAMACDDHDRGRYWYTEEVEIRMSFPGAGSESLHVSATAPAPAATGSAPAATDSTPAFGTAQDYSAAMPDFTASDESGSTQVHLVYKLARTPDVAYTDPWSLKHVHSGMNAGVVTLWSVSDDDGPAIRGLPTPAQAGWQAPEGFDGSVTLTVQVVHHLAKITVSKKKSTFQTNYTTNVSQVSYTCSRQLTVDFSRIDAG
jgi:hypothetical protein